MAEDKDKQVEIPDLGMKGEGIHPDRAAEISEAERKARERRKATRILLNMEVDYTSEDTFLFAYITDISTMGIFVRTNTPEAPGTMLNLQFTPPGEEEPLNLEGEVMWVNTYRPGDFTNLDPGMGVRFGDLSEADSRQIRSLIKRIAILEETDTPGEAPREVTPKPIEGA